MSGRRRSIGVDSYAEGASCGAEPFDRLGSSPQPWPGCSPSSSQVRGRAPATAPLFSPDGRSILFTRNESELWVMGADGNGLRKLASRASGATWSPDSRRIAYSSGPLVIERVDGSGRIIVPGNNTGPWWSPNGTLITFSRQAGDRTDLAVVRDDGRELRTIRRDARAIGWS